MRESLSYEVRVETQGETLRAFQQYLAQGGRGRPNDDELGDRLRKLRRTFQAATIEQGGRYLLSDDARTDISQEIERIASLVKPARTALFWVHLDGALKRVVI